MILLLLAAVLFLHQNIFAQGELDNSFGDEGKVVTNIVPSYNDYGYSTLIQQDGKIIVAGYAYNGPSSNANFNLIRYNTDGTIDKTFGSDGKVTTDFNNSQDIVATGSLAALQSDGKIIVGGYTYGGGGIFTTAFAIARYNTDGKSDSTFGTTGKIITDFGTNSGTAYAIAVQGDGKIVAGGYASDGTNTGFTVVRYNANGDLDGSFGTGGKVISNFGNGIYSLAIQSNDKIIAAGSYYNGASSDFAVLRYNTDGTLDATFGSGGMSLVDFGSNDYSQTVAIQQDGKILAGGYVYNNTDFDFGLTRFNTDGSVDLGFGSNGKIKTNFNSGDFGMSVALQSDGKIIFAGYSGSGTTDFAVARYSSDGTPDNSFGNNGMETLGLGNAQAFSAAVQTDGKILLSGYIFSDLTGSDFCSVRIDSDGALDNSFGANGISTTDLGNSSDWATSAALQSDGKILAAGYTNSGIHLNLALSRYNTDGTLDTSFSKDGIVTTDLGNNSSGSSVAVLSDKKIIVAGTYYNGSNNDFLLSRYNPDGTLDNTFPGGGSVITNLAGTDDYANSVAIQSNGKMLVAGSTSGIGGSDFALVRYNIDGTLDMSFDADGIVTTDLGNSDDMGSSVAVQPDGKIIVSGSSSNGINFDFALVRFNSDGSIDNDFGSNGKIKTDIQNSEDFGSSLIIQSDGKIILVGYSSIMGGNYELTLVRYNSNGTLDNSFGTNGKVITDLGTAFGYSNSAALQPDGKIVVVWNTYNGKNSDFVIVRYNSDGTLDNAFANNGVATIDFKNSNDIGSAVLIQNDGKIVAAGNSDNGFSNDFAVLRFSALFPLIQLSSSSVQFGNVFIDSSLTKSFFIKNTGTAPLQIDSIKNSNPVYTTTQNNLSIAPGDSQKVEITFKPLAAQVYNGKLIIYHNTSGSPDSINVSGSGIVKTNAVISLSASVLDFGSVTTNNSIKKTFFVKNTGTAQLKIDSIITNRSVFTIDTTKFNVVPGDSQKVDVTFTPVDTVKYTGELKIYHNASGSPSSINLSGTGKAKTAAVISLSETSLNFATVTINKSVPKNLFIRNIGTSSLKVDSIVSDKHVFTIDTTHFTILPGDSQKIKISFMPTDTINYNGKISIYHNASGSPTLINLTGKGTTQLIAVINISETTLNFGDLTVNATLNLPLSISNIGTGDLIIDSLSTNSNSFTVQHTGFTLKPDSSKSIEVTFSPKDSISYNSILTVYHKNLGSPNTINLTGRGVSASKPIVKLSSNSISFGNVVVDSSKTISFNIQNVGKVNLRVDSIRTNNSSFVAANAFFVLRPDSSRNISVIFEPKDSISYNGTLNIFHNATGSLSIISLTGTGISAANAVISISSNSVNFGDVAKGLSSTLKINIKNNGNSSLRVDSIKSDNSSFSVSPNQFTLAPSTSQDVSVAFTPADSAAYNGRINIYHNASGSPATITVSGNGFVYPSVLSVNKSITFGSTADINNYKIIGIPGNSNLAVSSLLQGDYQFDWNIYDDNGAAQDYLISSSDFKFSPGKAYWILSGSTLNINKQINAVQLDTSYFYSIPLHSGWNLISNPFEKIINWSNVKTLNGLPGNSVLYSWNGTSWENPSAMIPNQGFYFNNTGNLTVLKLRYEPRSALGKFNKMNSNPAADGKVLKIFLNDKKLNQTSQVYIGIDSLAKNEIDELDYYAPPADFQKTGISILKPELPEREKYLFVEQRPGIENGQEYDLEIKAVPNETLTLGIEEEDYFNKYNIYLLDERLKNFYNLKDQKSYTLKLAHQKNSFKLFIGDDNYIAQIKQTIGPVGYELYQNYPNPFNPSTTIRFSIPKQASITLKVYNILGQSVRTLIDNQTFESGTHELQFNGSDLASGVYILRLESSAYTMQRKMMLLK